MGDRLVGIALFLPVPFVLWLFTRAPFGIAPSLLLGVALVLTHRLYARPFALARGDRRCLWCGGKALSGPALSVAEPLGLTTWRACSSEHGAATERFLAFASRHALSLRIGILGTLGLFLLVAIGEASSRFVAVSSGDGVAFFRLGIAVTVLPLGWIGALRGRPGPEPPRVPFPVHIQALIGTRAVSWLFRLVGIVWLWLGALHVASRFGAS